MEPSEVADNTNEWENDADIAVATRALGEPDALFRVSRSRLRVKLFAGIGLMIYGVVANYFWWVHGPGRFGHVQFELLILPPILGVGLLRAMFRSRRLRVLIYPTGLLRLQDGEVESITWKSVDIVKIRVAGTVPIIERDTDGAVAVCWLPIAAPNVMVWTTWIEISSEEDTPTRISSALADYPALAERIQRETFAILWPNVLSELASGRTVPFGDLLATPAGLFNGKRLLPWAEIKEITISQKSFAVKRHGGWLPWFAKDVSAIPNPHVLIAIANMFGQRTSEEPEDDEAEE